MHGSMRDEDFERLMDAWAEAEVDAAPEMRPTAEMYRRVRARQQRRPWSLLASRPAIAVASAAALILAVVLFAILLRPSMPPQPPPTQVLAYVGLREGYTGERGVVTTPPSPPAKGPKGEQAFFRRLWFQVQGPDAPSATSFDVLLPQDAPVPLTSTDNYRLLLEPSREAYVYVYQLSPDGVLAPLFPDGAYSPAQNPLEAGLTGYLPAEPNWFYLAEGAGEERLYVVASGEPLPDLEDLVRRYSGERDPAGQRALLSSLLDRLATLVEAPSEEAAGWIFRFGRR
jgi:hypothetical protein